MKLFKKINPILCFTVMLYVSAFLINIAIKAADFIYKIFSGYAALAFFAISAGILFIILTVFWVISIIWAVKGINEQPEPDNLNGNRIAVYKLASIPIFGFWFLISMFPLAAFGNPFLFWMIPFVAPFSVVIFASSYVILIPSSIYGVTELIKLRRAGLISTNRMIVTGILLFIFVTDVFAAIDLSYFERKLKKKEFMLQ